MRFFIKIAYKGSSYFGWQLQNDVNTIQGVLQNALKIYFKENIILSGCGRTDTGVHAKEYFAHYDLNILSFNKNIANKTIYSLNAILPNDIKILDILQVKENAHARFHAITRTYQYYICTKPNPFCNEYAWCYPQQLNLEIMNDACKVLTENNDFAAFAKKGSNNHTTLCKLYSAEWIKKNDFLIFNIKADRFLRNMVRAIVGTLVDLGRNHIEYKQFVNIIENKNRSNAGQSAPAKGLYLTNIEYPENIFIKT